MFATSRAMVQGAIHHIPSRWSSSRTNRVRRFALHRPSLRQTVRFDETHQRDQINNGGTRIDNDAEEFCRYR